MTTEIVKEVVTIESLETATAKAFNGLGDRLTDAVEESAALGATEAQLAPVSKAVADVYKHATELSKAVVANTPTRRAVPGSRDVADRAIEDRSRFDAAGVDHRDDVTDVTRASRAVDPSPESLRDEHERPTDPALDKVRGSRSNPSRSAKKP